MCVCVRGGDLQADSTEHLKAFEGLHQVLWDGAVVHNPSGTRWMVSPNTLGSSLLGSAYAS